MKLGEVVYFKKATRTTKRGALETSFTGHAFGIMVGVVPPSRPEPSKQVLMMALAQMGYMSFDDVGEFLGKEQADLCVKKFEQKYCGISERPATEEAEAPVDSGPIPTPSGLVSPTGAPL